MSRRSRSQSNSKAAQANQLKCWVKYRSWLIIAAIMLGIGLSSVLNRPKHDTPLLTLNASQISDAMAKEAITIARQALPMLQRQDGSRFTAESDAESAQEVLSISDAKQTLLTGFISSLGEYCQLDWRPNFTRFMQHFRHDLGYSEKQMALIGFIHGYAMSIFSKDLTYDCSPENKAAIQTAPFK